MFQDLILCTSVTLHTQFSLTLTVLQQQTQVLPDLAFCNIRESTNRQSQRFAQTFQPPTEASISEIELCMDLPSHLQIGFVAKLSTGVGTAAVLQLKSRFANTPIGTTP